MKNLLLLLAVLAGLYMYTHPRVEQVPVVADATPAPVVVPPAPPQPKLYYHSPLDAPAMPVTTSTGTGYFSTDPASRFNGPYYGSSSASFPAYSGYPASSGGTVVNNNHVIYNNASAVPRTTSAYSTPPVVIAGRPPVYNQNSSLENTRTSN